MHDSEQHILNNYMIDAWCSNALSPGLRKEIKGKTHRYGAPCCLKTLREIRNTVRETTLRVHAARRGMTSTTERGHDIVHPHLSSTDVAPARRIMEFTGEHKMQSAPLFAGKFTDDGW